MIVYKVFNKNYEHEQVTLLGMLAERRRDLRGKTRIEAGLTWARLTFGGSAKEKESIFVVPKELEAGPATRVLMKRTIFYKDELLDILDPLAFSQKRKILTSEAETVEAEKNNLLSDNLLDVIGGATSYNEFYGFSEKPFEVVPDPQFFYSSPSHLSVLTSVINGIESRENLMCVIGEVGTGKTTFVHFLLHCLEEKVKTTRIIHPPMTFEELVSNILLGLDQIVVEEKKQALLDQLNTYLTKKMSEDETLVVIVDEAQNLPSEVMEELGTFYEGGRWAGRLQIILVGAPELEHKIGAPGLRQFGREIGVRCRISPLTEEESRKYIDHRLKLVGSRSREVFTPEAISTIIQHARGFPRVINIVCDNVFMIGYGLSKTRVDEDMVRQAVKDMEAPIQRKFISTRIIRAVKEIPFLAEAVNFLRRKFLSSSSY
ncbi:MAG TPA: AAA family ATPase [Thermodesulfobacteriota bacterium]|nr:AAA family ATPase [Thermodesulfobacteriota bacterium]